MKINYIHRLHTNNKEARYTLVDALTVQPEIVTVSLILHMLSMSILLSMVI